MGQLASGAPLCASSPVGTRASAAKGEACGVLPGGEACGMPHGGEAGPYHRLETPGAVARANGMGTLEEGAAALGAIAAPSVDAGPAAAPAVPPVPSIAAYGRLAQKQGLHGLAAICAPRLPRLSVRICFQERRFWSKREKFHDYSAALIPACAFIQLLRPQQQSGHCHASRSAGPAQCTQCTRRAPPPLACAPHPGLGLSA